MKLEFTISVKRKLRKITIKNRLLSQRIEKQLDLFTQNPQHPSLRFHKLSGGLENLWSISITKSIRMTYVQTDDTAIFTDIGTHDEVYQK